MSRTERILALEAALCAAEGQEDMPVEILNKLHKWIDDEIDHMPDLQDNGRFTDKQKEACIILANNPQVYGG